MDTRNGSGECCLRWNDHQTLLHGVCDSLLTSEKFADVTLFCEGMSLKCHKFLLSACSSYFEQIFSETELDHPIIILKDVVYWEMQALLHFIYRGELTTDENKLGSLIELARSLHIKGIGDFDARAGESSRKSRKTQKKRVKMEHGHNREEKSPQSMEEYLNNINALSEPMLALSQESQPTLEIGCPFTTEPTRANPRADQSMPAQYPEPNTDNYQAKQNADSEADVSSDTSLLTSYLAMTPAVYKQYGEQNLLSAIKSVLDDGVKQVEACVKYGIPFTTLTRKIRQYKYYGGRLPVTQHPKGNLRSRKHSTQQQQQQQEEAPKSRGQRRPPEEEEDEEEELHEHLLRQQQQQQHHQQLLIQQQLQHLQHQEHQQQQQQQHQEEHQRPVEISLANSQLVENDAMNAGGGEEQMTADHSMDTEERPVWLNRYLAQDSVAAKNTKPLYKKYTEEHLREAIQAVVSQSMRTSEASEHYRIPLTTLMRKIRSFKENGSLGVPPCAFPPTDPSS